MPLARESGGKLTAGGASSWKGEGQGGSDYPGSATLFIQKGG